MFSGCGGAAGAALGVSGSFWCSQKRMVCGTPFSVTVKSLAVSPSMGFPFLSFTTTVSTTSCVLTLDGGRPVAFRRRILADLLGAHQATCTARRKSHRTGAFTAISSVSHTVIAQNLSRSVVCRLRMALAAVGNPNCVLLMVVFQLVKVT